MCLWHFIHALSDKMENSCITALCGKWTSWSIAVNYWQSNNSRSIFIFEFIYSYIRELKSLEISRLHLSVEVSKFKNTSSFQELIDVEGDGMADMVFRCIQEMDIDNRMMVLWLDPKYITFLDHFTLISAYRSIYIDKDNWSSVFENKVKDLLEDLFIM